jgi:hypothetical protein
MVARLDVEDGVSGQRGRKVAGGVLAAAGEIDLAHIGRRHRLGGSLLAVGGGAAAKCKPRMPLDGRDQFQKLSL